MSVVLKTLERFGVETDAEEVEELVARAMEEILAEWRPLDPRTNLSDNGPDTRPAATRRRPLPAGMEKRAMMEPGELPVYLGSGNVFQDLGFEDAEELTVKSQLAFIIRGIIKRRRLAQVRAASILGIDQPRVSDLMRYRTEGFSLKRLLHFVRALGVDVEITLRDPVGGRSGSGSYDRLEVVTAG